MKNVWCRVRETGVAVLASFLLFAYGSPFPGELIAQETSSLEATKTLSPYFLIKSADETMDQLPLKRTSADVRIAGVVADVTVEQVYANTGKRAIEAVYIFPASTRAAVHGMTMTIGERVITAVIREREQARADYEKAKAEGKTASLLEQQRPNVFQMNVANILPGDTVKVRLQYTELLVPEDGVYEFVYPTVVGPRYSNKPAESASTTERWVANPFLHAGEKTSTTFDITVNLVSGTDIHDLRCSTHQINTDFKSRQQAAVRLDKSESLGGNRDFILQYRLSDNRVDSGLILFDGQDDDFFLLTVQPPKVVPASQMPPREYIFVVDVSGSMSGYPLETSKQVLKELARGLRPQDSFNVLLFAGGSRTLFPSSLPATRANVEHALNIIDNEHAGGGTELLPALKEAFALPRRQAGARSLIVITDGYVEVERETFRLIRENLRDANLFAFGIGSSVNRYLIEGMARAGMGTPFIVTHPDEAEATAFRFVRYIQTPALAQVRVEAEGFDVYDLEPENPPDVLADRPVVVLGKWRGPASGKISIRGITGEGIYARVIDVAQQTPTLDGIALQRMWALSRISRFDDDDAVEGAEAHREAIVQLSLRYNLLTRYTSFVAIDELVRREGGHLTRVKQPLPMPANVSDSAVGNAIPGTPEPETWMLIFAACGFLAWALMPRRRRV